MKTDFTLARGRLPVGKPPEPVEKKAADQGPRPSKIKLIRRA